MLLEIQFCLPFLIRFISGFRLLCFLVVDIWNIFHFQCSSQHLSSFIFERTEFHYCAIFIALLEKGLKSIIYRNNLDNLSIRHPVRHQWKIQLNTCAKCHVLHNPTHGFISQKIKKKKKTHIVCRLLDIRRLCCNMLTSRWAWLIW